MAKSRFGDLEGQLNDQTEKAVVTKAASEKELFATITANLNQLKAFLDEGAVSGEDFKQIIDAAASVAGKTLGEEKIGGSEGKTVKVLLDELLEEEGAYNDGKRILLDNARKLKVDVDTYLANTKSSDLNKVVAIKDEAERMAAELRVGVKAYALSLVDQLQANNTQKGAKTDEELAEWRTAFAPAESSETGSHENQMASIVVKFVEEQGILSETEQAIKIPELRASKRASKEVIWKNYANFARRAAEARFPLKEDQDRCRDFLRRLLDSHNKPFAIDTHSGNTMIIVDQELGDNYQRETLRPIILEYVRARLLSTAQLDRSSLTLNDIVRILAITRSKEMTHASMIEGIAKLVGHPSRELTADITEQTAKLETDFLNKLDAEVQFLFTSIPKNAQENITNGVGDYRLFSPIWKGEDERYPYPKTFALRPNIQATTDGALYSPQDVENRISDTDAMKAKEAFAQQLSNALNKGKLQEDQTAVTAKDRNIAKNRGTIAAEQRVLAAETAQTEAEKKMKEFEAKLAASEAALQAEKSARMTEKTAADGREASLKIAITDLRTEKGILKIAEGESKAREAALTAKLGKWSEYGKSVNALIAETVSAASKAFLGGVSLKTFKGYVETHIPGKNPDQE